MIPLKKIIAGCSRRALLPQMLTGLTVVFACVLLFFTNTGCEMIKALTTYVIELSPPYFALTAPGQQGVVKASLVWSAAEGTRNLEAKTWTVDSGLPPVLESATWTPKQNSIYTDITLKCSSDASRFGASDLWAASVNSSYMVGVKATFEEPIWKSISGGQQVVISRKAFLPLRVENPRVVVIQTDHHPIAGNYWAAAFRMTTENPVEGWTYRVKAYAREIFKTTGEVTNLVSSDFAWQGVGGSEASLSANPSDDQYASYAVFEITYQNHLGATVRQERKVFSY